MKAIFQILFVGLVTTWATAVVAADTDSLLKTIKAVGLKGSGNVEAAQAMQQLSRADANVLFDILAAFENATPLATNYLRGAFESIAHREVKQGNGLPVAKLEEFILDTKQNSRARRVAYEWLIQVDEKASDRLIPGMLLDPGPEFRRDAVQRLIAAAKELEKKKQTEKATALYRQALQGATDADLVKIIVGPLKKLGNKVDIQTHFGFLSSWNMAGPFDNRQKIGFAIAYPPEKNIDLKATYKGQLGDVKWAPVTTDHDYGIVDIAKAISPYKGAVMYATTEFVVPAQQSIEFRLGTVNAWKLWLNEKQLFAREEYHRGMAMDQYRVQAELKPGRNTILLKICQNEQTQNWAQRYQFQIRVCDLDGLAVLSQNRQATSQRDSLKTRSLTAQKN